MKFSPRLWLQSKVIAFWTYGTRNFSVIRRKSLFELKNFPNLLRDFWSAKFWLSFCGQFRETRKMLWNLSGKLRWDFRGIFNISVADFHLSHCHSTAKRFPLRFSTFSLLPLFYWVIAILRIGNKFNSLLAFVFLFSLKNFFLFSFLFIGKFH